MKKVKKSVFPSTFCDGFSSGQLCKQMTGIFTCTLNNHLVNVSSKDELDKSLIWELRIKQTSEVLITKQNTTTEVLQNQVFRMHDG